MSAQAPWVGFSITPKEGRDDLVSFSVVGDGVVFTQLVDMDDLRTLHGQLGAVLAPPPVPRNRPGTGPTERR